MRFQNMKGRVNYEPNSFNTGGCPFSASVAEGGYFTWPQPVSGQKVRERSSSFSDYFSQASLFYNSLATWEKNHLVDALRFELSKVETFHIRERMVDRLNHVNFDLAKRVAAAIGVTPPSSPAQIYPNTSSPALSQENTVYIPKGLKVGIILVDGFYNNQVNRVRAELTLAGISSDLISTRLGNITGANGHSLSAAKTLFNSESVFYDAIFVPCVEDSEKYSTNGRVQFFIVEAFKHCKPIGLTGKAINLLEETNIHVETSTGLTVVDHGVVTLKKNSDLDNFTDKFIEAVVQQRFFERQDLPFYNDLVI